MTEPEAGSALGDLRTRAAIEGDEVVLNGAKVFGTHGDSSDWFCAWARFGTDRRAVGAVLVPRDAPGLSVDGSHRFMSGERYGQLYFDDCRGVPRANVLVERTGLRKLVAPSSTSSAWATRRARSPRAGGVRPAVAYARERRQFGRRLIEFQGLQWRFAEMKLKLDAARLLLYRAAANADAGLPSPTGDSAREARLQPSRLQVANDALQIFGGTATSRRRPSTTSSAARAAG